VSETCPAFDGLAVDERGRVWIGLRERFVPILEADG
jgi:hypothetical protein